MRGHSGYGKCHLHYTDSFCELWKMTMNLRHEQKPFTCRNSYASTKFSVAENRNHR